MLTDIKDASAALAQILGVTGLVWMLFFSYNEKNRASIVKLIGSALVLALAFAANNAFTYGLAIFIVATLVTDLDFLEKLAALFWNRDKYWEYQLKKQSPDETAAKAAKEADDILSEKQVNSDQPPFTDSAVEPEPDPERKPEPERKVEAEVVDNTVASKLSKPNIFIGDESLLQSKLKESRQMTRRILNFEALVSKAIVSDRGPFVGAVASTGFILEVRDRRFEIDLIVKVPGAHYVAEIKYGATPRIVKEGEMRIREVARVYEAYLMEKGQLDVMVIPMLIVSSQADCSRVGSAVTLLKYDEGTNSFV